MTKRRVMNRICSILFFLLSPFVFSIGSTDANEFEIDEVITAIINEIQTANSSELGSPNFLIENVDVSFSIASRETQKGALSLKIIGYSNEDDINITTLKSHHKLHYSFKPTETSDFSPEISLGLVEPIRQVKSSFRKAFNTSPNIDMDDFTFKIEFAIVQNLDNRMRFIIFELDKLKGQKVTTHHITLKFKIK